jgi:GTP cyclohydrolase I
MSIWDRVDGVQAAGGASANGRVARHPPPDQTALKDLTRGLITALGEDPEREGLLETPERVSRSLSDLTAGYRQTLEDVVGDALFAEDYDELVLVRDIAFYSLCEHHLLPIIGQAHVAYLPDGCVVGLSKLPRIVDMFAHRLQVQERLTRQIAEAVDQALRPRGVGVVIAAEHMCMAMRGVQKTGTRTVTSCLLGEIDADPNRRAEFLALARA